MMKYNAYLQKLRENKSIRLLIAVSKMSQTFEMTIRCMSIAPIAFSKLSVGSFYYFCFAPVRPGPILSTSASSCVALLRFIIFGGTT